MPVQAGSLTGGRGVPTNMGVAPPAPVATRSEVRPEIQMLRALAVALVVIFHLWPQRLPGGFIGVDVFFVVSGFLITGHLAREAETRGTIRLGDFWARRTRRLLPASFTVLLASLPLVIAYLPGALWQRSLAEIRSAALYVENWVLAINSVDYLAAENEPSIVQHFWSLSVEEQFYIVWPVIVIAVLWAANRMRTPRRHTLALALGAIGLASFVYSVWLSAVSPAPAYFSSPVRMWEFAAGGVLALSALGGVTGRGPTWVRATASWAGLALIVLASVVMDGSWSFPGWVAAVPVLGTVLVIAAGHVTSPFSPTRYGALRPIQWLGDISYSVYLWHWPLIAVAAAVLGRTSPLFGVGTILVTLILAAATRRFVEDRFRSSPFLAKTPRRSLLMAATGMLVITALTLGAGSVLSGTAQDQERAAEEMQGCLGASARWTPDCTALVGDQLFPPVTGIAEDIKDQYTCYIDEGTALDSCSYGDEDADLRIAVVGDSHAASLLPGLIELTQRRSWKVDTFVGDGCRLGFPESCVAGDAIEESVATGEYDLILAVGISRYQPSVPDLVERWGALVGSGARIVPVVDVPTVSATALECVQRGGPAADLESTCVTPTEEAMLAFPDRYGSAGEQLGFPVIDLTPTLCESDVHCSAVMRNVIIYRDEASHITSTFSRSLSVVLEDEIDAALLALEGPHSGRKRNAS